MKNPILETSKLAYEAIDFNNIKEEDFLPALKDSISYAKVIVEDIKKEKEINFKNIIGRLEAATDQMDMVTSVFYPLYSAHCTEGISKLAEEFSGELTKYNSDVSLDEKLFLQVKALWDKKDSLKLTTEESTILYETYTTFTRNGALLNESDKNKLRAIDEKLSSLGIKFSENVRNATHDFYLVVDNENDLKGIPKAAIDQASIDAKTRDHAGKWVFTLEFPSYLPFMQYCQNRSLRQKMSEAVGKKAFGGKFDNSAIALDYIHLSHERAMLLGYKSFADYTLEKRMARNLPTVMQFIQEFCDRALPAAKRDFKKLVDLKTKLTKDSDFQRWDGPFYTEILKKEELSFDDEMLRPYFKLENVINGVFLIAQKLYDITFTKIDAPKYHADVEVYKVEDKDKKFVGLFYADFFPRKEKRPGAWMTTFRNQGLSQNEMKRPFISIVCNFTKPTSDRPSLLTLDEVRTLFHEFGHALHGLLTKCTYRSVSGTNVYWDFVELPSQIMENWATEKECLDLFAVHYQTGEKMPADLIDKIKKESQFLEGMGTLRQMSFSMLDMSWFGAPIEKNTDIAKHEDTVMAKYDLYPRDGKSNMTCSFGHIFGGYSSGYYSYKWAEVLDADAFEYFQQKGIFNKDVARAFKENILEKGGSEDPMLLYKKFRGREPKIDALLVRSGLA